jgi:hypothetical protein
MPHNAPMDNTKRQEFTLTTKALDNGCLLIDTDSIMEFAIKHTGTATERMGFERFSLIDGSHSDRTNNKNQLKAWLETVPSGTKAVAFRNGGKGVTIELF